MFVPRGAPTVVSALQRYEAWPANFSVRQHNIGEGGTVTGGTSVALVRGPSTCCRSKRRGLGRRDERLLTWCLPRGKSCPILGSNFIVSSGHIY